MNDNNFRRQNGQVFGLVTKGKTTASPTAEGAAPPPLRGIP